MTMTLTKQGSFDADVMNALNTGVAGIVANVSSPVTTFTVLAAATAVTLLPANHPAGMYRFSIYGVVTTSITTATSWLFPIGYTDTQGAKTPTAATSSTMTAGAVVQASYHFYSTGVAAITVTPTSTSAAAGAVAYYISLARLI